MHVETIGNCQVFSTAFHCIFETKSLFLNPKLINCLDSLAREPICLSYCLQILELQMQANLH